MESIKKIGKVLYAGWMKFAHVLGLIMTTLQLTIVYFLPFGITAIIRMLANISFKKKDADSSLYFKYDYPDQDIDTAERQF